MFAVLCSASFSGATERNPTVISSSTVSVGSHAVIIQRVEPPPPRETNAAVTAAAGIHKAASSSAESLTIPPANVNRLRPEVLSLSCTRYECGVTEVRWQDSTGGEYRAFSSIDFNHLRNVGGFTDSDRSYTIFMGVGNAMPVPVNGGGSAPTATRSAPVSPPVDVSTLANVQAPGLSRYIMVAAPEKPDVDAFRGIDALHRFFDAHKEELIAQWQQIEAERIIREQFEKEHPPQPKDTVIQFWPKKNSRYLNPLEDILGSAATQIISGEEAK